jgi:hypothetical protein
MGDEGGEMDMKPLSVGARAGKVAIAVFLALVRVNPEEPALAKVKPVFARLQSFRRN